MTSIASEFPARGKIIRAADGKAIFAPSNTNYELQLVVSPESTGPIPVGVPIEGVIRVKARKLLSVPPGGNFVAPIFGTPRTIQGRVRTLDERSLVVQAGTTFVVELPERDDALDLNNGSIVSGSFINVIVMPGASFEFIRVAGGS